MRNDCSVREFAQIMGVVSETVYAWIYRDLLPSAFRNEKQQWRIPIDAERPTKQYLRKQEFFNSGFTQEELAARKSLLTMKDGEIAQLKAELLELNKCHMDLMYSHAGLLGRYEALVEVHKRTREDVTRLENEVEEAWRAFEAKANENEQLALTTGQLTPHKEELCQDRKTASSSTPSTDSTRQSQRASGAAKRRTR